MQAVILFQWFFLQPTQWASLYYFRKIYTMWFLLHLFFRHDLFTFPNFCGCVDDTFLVPNESAWQSLERQREIMVWSSSLFEERFICRSISRSISLMFNQLQFPSTYCVFTNYFMILKNFCMPLFGRFQFWAPTRFSEVICPRYHPSLSDLILTTVTLSMTNRSTNHFKKD